ncbi:PstS family phosphate ABC transporter substrate-binding protein [Pleurocapsales cyanobacterium LEGE 06147]|nr:PstS family phosphate ABC transporter substrate-binding protein [Pleurocapsales cyanobacterium LEGE 06147]
MKIKTEKRVQGLEKLGLTVAFTSILAACTQVSSEQNPSIAIDGSSTVYPITQAIAQEFKATKDNRVDLKVNFSGTTSGFKKFCAGQTQINDASRPISTAEMAACKQAKIAYIELPITFDAIAVVVNPRNNWLDSITVDQLKKIWSPKAENQITRWNQINADWPDRPLNLFGPGEDSGTFDYFTEAVVGRAEASRTDYVRSEDDNILVQAIKQDPNALGYFGFAYYQARPNELKALAIDSGQGPVFPSRETVEAGEYQPLSRPLFIYVNSSAVQKNPALKEFVEFYLDRSPEIVSSVGYIPLSEEGYQLTNIHFHRGKVGTVFEGKSALNLTMGELLRKQAKF